jgi:DNA repair exonuclease SbcCD nuclease subunit
MSIKVLCVGDPHFKVNNVPESDDMTDKLVKIAEHIKPKFIVLLGDILHTHEKIHVSPLMRAEKLVRQLSQISPTFVIIGNHDRPNNSTYLTDDHAFNAMKQWTNTYVVDDKVLDTNIAGHRFLFVPYVFPSLFMSTLTHEEKGVKDPLLNTTAIFCHQEFLNAKMGMIESKAGDPWDTNHPLVISGHVHDYDRLQPNLIYVGTPMQHAFGDKDDKTVSLFTFDNIDNKISWNEDRIDLGLIKRVIVYITPEEIHTYEPPTDKLIKLTIRGDSSSIAAVKKLEKINELRKQGININFKVIKTTEEPRKGPVLRMRYKDRFYSEICQDSKQLDWFDKLFNSINK